MWDVPLFCTHGHPLEVISHWFLSGRFWLLQSAGGLSPPADDDYHLLYIYKSLQLVEVQLQG